MAKIVAVQRGLHGELCNFKLETGEVLGYDAAVEAVKSGKIEGCNIGKDRNGYDSIKSNRDGYGGNNLTELPEFKV